MFLQFVLCQVVILLFVEFNPASCDTFYIVPTPNSHCPGEFTCLTLDQYASNSSQSQNITFLVEPGTYNLSTTLTVSNGYNFTMSSTNATVVCTSSTAQFIFIRVENVHISGMTFTKCRSNYSGAIRMSRVGIAYIRNSLFIDNGKNNSVGLGITNTGGALYAYYSTVSISDCRFENNRAYYGGAIFTPTDSHLTINGSVFNNNIATYYGGGVYFTSSFAATLIVDNTTFSHNSVTYFRGGAIDISGTLLNIHVTNTVFSDNRARSELVQYGGDGGALSLRTDYQSRNECGIIIGCQFINNFANGSGGAVYQYGNNCEFVLERNNFSNNRANDTGGAVYFGGTSTSISVTDSSFVNNRAVKSGGAIYSIGNYVSLSSSTFTNNSASSCSVLAVANYYHVSVNFTNSVFTYNTATDYIGGVACIYNTSINILNSVFKHNSAYFHNAGVFYIYDSVTTVDGSLFMNNAARWSGGVFYMSFHASDFIIKRSQFSRNSAGSGGVLVMWRSNSSVSIDESIFDFNSARNGGVINLSNSLVFMEINRTNISNNRALNGGVMRACNSQVTLLDDRFVVTVDPWLSSCTLYDHEPEITMTTTSPTTEAPTTTAPPTTTASPTSTAADDVTTIAMSTTETSEKTETDPLTTSDEINSPSTSLPITTDEDTTPPLTDKAPPTTLVYTRYSNPTTTEKQTSTTELLDKDINQSPTRGQSTTTDSIPDQVAVSIENAMFNLITIVLAVSLAVSVVAIIFLFLLALMLIKCPNKPKVLPLTQEFYPTRSFYAYTSPVYNPAYCSKEKDKL